MPRSALAWRTALTTLVLLVLWYPTLGNAVPLQGKLVSTGSDTLGALTSLWAQSLMQAHPAVNVQVRAIGSSAAPTALIEGTADIGPMSRGMSSLEVEDFVARYGYPPTAVPVAMDRLAIFVHRENPLHSITRDQLERLFSINRRCSGGDPLVRWGELGAIGAGWAQRPVTRYGRSAASGTYAFFRRQLLCGGDFSPEVNRLVGSAAVVHAVAADRSGIGYASAGFLNADVRPLRVVESPGGEELSLSRELLLYINLPPEASLSPVVRAFIAEALSEEGQAMVRSTGYLPLPRARRRALQESLEID